MSRKRRIEESKTSLTRDKRRMIDDDTARLISILDKILEKMKTEGHVANQFALALYFIIDENETNKVRHERFINELIPILAPLIGESSAYITPSDLEFLETIIQDPWFREFLRSYLLSPSEKGWSILDDWWFNQIFKTEFLDRVSSFIESDSCVGPSEKINQWLQYLINHEIGLPACVPDSKNLWLESDGKIMNEDEFIGKLEECYQSSNDRIVFQFVHATSLAAHSGLIFIDKANKTYERFEPHGYFAGGWDDTFVDVYFEFLLPQKVTWLQEFKYFSNLKICPRIGPQILQAKAVDCPAGSGFCVAFSLIYAHLRILGQRFPPALIISKLTGMKPSEILSLVRRYITWMNFIIR
jgi:hypothetical protein